MKDNKNLRIGFEDTDKKLTIEIYGKEFNINESRLSELETNEIAEEKDIDVMDKTLDEILGAGSVEILNNIRKENGYGRMGVNNELAIFMKLVEVYAYSVFEPLEEAEKKFDDMYRKMNRFERRNYNNKYRNNRYRR